MSGNRKHRSEGLANSSLSTSRVPPQDGQPGDPLSSHRDLPGNDQQQGLEAEQETEDGSERRPSSKE